MNIKVAHSLPLIRSGQYEFPKPEWTNVSQDAKELIKGCLKTNPEERLTIDDVIRNKWIAQYNAVPQTPLLTSDVLKEENEQWPDVQQGMSLALREMRVDQVSRCCYLLLMIKSTRVSLRSWASKASALLLGLPLV